MTSRGEARRAGAGPTRPPAAGRSPGRRWWRIGGAVAVVLGIWIAVVPFHRPIPGGDISDWSRTPQVACGPALTAAFQGSDDTLLLPEDTGAGVVVVDPDGFCQGRARFRLASAVVLAAAGGAALALVRRRHLGGEARP